jgi:hypothetical protein
MHIFQNGFFSISSHVIPISARSIDSFPQSRVGRAPLPFPSVDWFQEALDPGNCRFFVGHTQIFVKGLFLAKLLAMSWQPAILHGNWRPPTPPTHLYHRLDGHIVDFVHISTHSLLTAAVAGPIKAVHDSLPHPVYRFQLPFHQTYPCWIWKSIILLVSNIRMITNMDGNWDFFFSWQFWKNYNACPEIKFIQL